MKSFIFTIASMLLLFGNILGQYNYAELDSVRKDFTNKLEKMKSELDMEDLNKLELAENQTILADKDAAVADNMFEDAYKFNIKADSETNSRKMRKFRKKASKLRRKGIKRRLKAAEIYEQANNAVFTVCRNKYSSSYDEIDTVRTNYTNKLTEEATILFSEARLLKRKFQKGRAYESKMNEMFLNAHKKEMEGITKEIVAIGVFFGWYPVEKLAEKAETTETLDNDIIASKSNEASNIKETKNIEVEIDQLKGIVFKVQILATQKPTDKKTLKSVYNNTDDYFEYYDSRDYNFKYSIGYYKNYNEAKNFCEGLEINSVCVVAFRDGLPMKLEYAIEESQK